MDQLQLPSGVDELEEWLERSGGRTGRIVGVRRARWEDWCVVHRLATSGSSPFGSGLRHIRRVGDGFFELSAAPGAPVDATLSAAMLFFDISEEPGDVVDLLFQRADHCLRQRAAIGRPRWLAIDLALDEADLDPAECLELLAEDPRLAELKWFDYCALFLGGDAPILVTEGALQPCSSPQ